MTNFLVFFFIQKVKSNMKKKVCKRCKMFVEGNECPVCKTNQFSTSWQGRLFIMDSKESMIAGKVGIKDEGEYAIKVR